LGSFSRFLNDACDVENILYYMRTHCFSCESKTCKVALAGSKCIETHGIVSTATFCYTVQKINHGFFSEIAATIVSLCDEKLREFGDSEGNLIC
jgi:hypothetical protein